MILVHLCALDYSDAKENSERSVEGLSSGWKLDGENMIIAICRKVLKKGSGQPLELITEDILDIACHSMLQIAFLFVASSAWLLHVVSGQ